MSKAIPDNAPNLYVVTSGDTPKIETYRLKKETDLSYQVYYSHGAVHNGDGSQVYNIFKRRLEVSRTKALTDRTKAVALLLHHLQEAKAQSERRIARIDAAIKEIMDKEGL